MKYRLRSLIIVAILGPPLHGEETKLQAAKPIVANSAPHWLASEKLSKALLDDRSEQRCVSSAEDVVAIHAVWRRMEKQKGSGFICCCQRVGS
jgi:hypothetical protein